ncbi:MAG TPA: AAA family ATPase [Candidatus Limnocylindrales bacterium]|nr:AAA family ATPase [Candidatus Limnocylindrales bacterium]
MSQPVRIAVPAGSLVLLIGPSGSGKTTFAAEHFPRTHVLGSDEMRAIVADDPNDQAATEAAFELLHTALRLRLAGRRTTAVDATNVERWAREGLLAIARRFGRPALAVVLALPLEVCLSRNAARVDRRPVAAIRRQHRVMCGSLATLPDEGFSAVHILESEEQVRATRVETTA